VGYRGVGTDDVA
jgi:hypothetical protein